MSLTFKLTIPDGVLKEHLLGRDSKSRNFELIRLATNDLVKLSYAATRETVTIQPDAVTQAISDKVIVRDVDQYLGIIPDTVKNEIKALSIESPKMTLEESANFVDFGEDLLSMS